HFSAPAPLFPGASRGCNCVSILSHLPANQKLAVDGRSESAGLAGNYRRGSLPGCGDRSQKEIYDLPPQSHTMVCYLCRHSGPRLLGFHVISALQIVAGSKVIAQAGSGSTMDRPTRL